MLPRSCRNGKAFALKIYSEKHSARVGWIPSGRSNLWRDTFDRRPTSTNPSSAGQASCGKAASSTPEETGEKGRLGRCRTRGRACRRSRRKCRRARSEIQEGFKGGRPKT